MSFHVRSYSCNVNKIYIFREISRAIVDCMQLLQRETWEFIFRTTCVLFDWELITISLSFDDYWENHELRQIWITMCLLFPLLSIGICNFCRSPLFRLKQNFLITNETQRAYVPRQKSHFSDYGSLTWLILDATIDFFVGSDHIMPLQPDTYSWSSTQLRLDYVRRSMSQERDILRTLLGFKLFPILLLLLILSQSQSRQRALFFPPLSLTIRSFGVFRLLVVVVFHVPFSSLSIFFWSLYQKKPSPWELEKPRAYIQQWTNKRTMTSQIFHVALRRRRLRRCCCSHTQPSQRGLIRHQ